MTRRLGWLLGCIFVVNVLLLWVCEGMMQIKNRMEVKAEILSYPELAVSVGRGDYRDLIRDLDAAFRKREQENLKLKIKLEATKTGDQ